MSLAKQFTIKHAISRAQKAIKQGNTALALQLYNEVIQHQPNHPIARKGLRMLQKELPHDQFGQPQLTNPSQNQIIELRNLFQSGQMTKAEQVCRELLQAYPQSLMVINLYGAALKVQGKLQEAVQAFDMSIELKPDSAAAYYNRGVVLGDLGHLEKAVASYDKAIELKPDYAEVYSNRGVALENLGHLEKAVASYDKAIKLMPDYAAAYYNRGVALGGLRQFEKAVASYDKAIKLMPNDAEAYYNRGIALGDLGHLEKAVASYDKAIQLKPDYAEAYSNRGVALGDLGHLEKAVASYDKAIQLKPDDVEAYSNRGFALKTLGQLEKAAESINKVIQLKPDDAEAHRSLSTIKRYKPDDVQIGIMESLFTNSELSEPDRMQLCFALAKAYEDLGEYDISFSYLEEGNRLRKKELKYHIDDDRILITKIRETFTSESQALDVASDGNASIHPLFIVGMPRSGTSLVEQVLASHTKVYGAGELGAMTKLVSPILSNLPDQNVSPKKSKFPQNEIKTVYDGYLAVLTSLNVPEKIITDKMPLNFQWVGFILSAFPEAKIIHLNRDPMATCWSIYKHYFSGKGNGYAYDMCDLMEFYMLYIDLMSFWRERFPNSIYDLCYEDLTKNQEEESRRLLEYCDLEWEEQCLDFHKTKRVVRTASALQVREKMYKGSSEAWRKYEGYLQPLIKGLGYQD